MLAVKSLTCLRGNREIFRDIGFSLDAGKALLVTGENGSGKSSLLRVLAGMLAPESGEIFWRGQSIAEDPDAYHGDLRYVGHLDAVKHALTVGEMLDYWRALNCLPHAALQEDPFGILALRDKPVRYLSAGQKRRLALSRLMLGPSSLWLLDEPATALDREGQSILLDCIARHRAAGGIIVIATHHDMNVPHAEKHQMKRHA